jgi:hypothetical protein
MQKPNWKTFLGAYAIMVFLGPGCLVALIILPIIGAQRPFILWDAIWGGLIAAAVGYAWTWYREQAVPGMKRLALLEERQSDRLKALNTRQAEKDRINNLKAKAEWEMMRSITNEPKH